MSDSTRGGKRRTRRHDPAAAMLAAVKDAEDALEWMTTPHPEIGPQQEKRRRDPRPGELEVVCGCRGEGHARQIAILVPLDGLSSGGWREARSGSAAVGRGIRLYCDKCKVDVRLSSGKGEKLAHWVEATGATRLDLLAFANVLST